MKASFRPALTFQPFNSSVNTVYSILFPRISMDSILAAVTWLGSLYVLLPSTVLLALVLLKAGRPNDAALLGLSLPATTIVVHLVKLVVRRPRPEVLQPGGADASRLVLSQRPHGPGGYVFPGTYPDRDPSAATVPFPADGAQLPADRSRSRLFADPPPGPLSLGCHCRPDPGRSVW